MATELIPVVDLRLLSQADLNTLSLSSPNSFDLNLLSDVVPKIDRSVFNESAGSRKQTYSRLPLSQSPQSPNPQSLPRRRGRPRLHPHPSPAAPSATAAGDDPGRQENLQIVSFLRQLFESQNVKERALVLVEDRDREVKNGTGEEIDLVGLGMKEDLFGEEIRRRTEGLRTEEQLLGYMTGLDGQWGSRRKKRKIVDAGVFGDELPRGWKVLLGLKRKEGVVYLNCRRYVSPSGKHFVSCKEVSSYILSLIGHQDARQPISGQHDGSAARPDKFTLGCVAGLSHQDETKKEISNCSFVTPISYISAECEKQGLLFRVEKQAMTELKNILECHKCNLTFGNKDAHLQHLLTFHQRSAKRRRLGKSLGDGVIVKDGKYECQFCHKTFSERHRYNGHIGAHVRYQGLGAEVSSCEITVGTSDISSSLAVVPYVPSEMNVSANKNEETITTKSVDEIHMENNEIEHNPKTGAPEISEAVSTSKFVDNQVKDCDVTCYKLNEVIEASNVTCIKSNACTDVISPSVIDVNNVAQDCSPIITQEASASQSVLGQIDDCEMTGDKSEGVIEDSKVQDAKPNVCLDAIASAVANVDVATCETITETGLSSSTSKFIDGNSSDHNMVGYKSEDIVATGNAMSIETINEIGLSSLTSKFVGGNINDCDMAGYKSDIVDTTNAMSIEANACLDALSPSLVNVDRTTYENSNAIDPSSCTVVSAIENYNGDQKVDTPNHLIALSVNGSSYGVETYANDIFTSTVEEHVEMDTSINETSDSGSCHALTNKDTDTGSTMHKELNSSCIVTTFGSAHTCGIETNADCMFPSDVNKSMFEEIDKAGNELQNCFHRSNAGCDEDAAGDIMNNDDGRQALQVNVANTSSLWVQSSDSLPILDLLPDQCEDEFGGIGPKNEQENVSGFEELRLGSIQPADFVLLTGQESGSVARSPIELVPSDQLEWGISSPKMVNTGEPTSLCVWCNREFSHEGGEAEPPESESLGYMCPECKAKISGQLDLLDNGLS